MLGRGGAKQLSQGDSITQSKYAHVTQVCAAMDIQKKKKSII